MSERYITADRDQMSLLPYDLRDWIPEDDFVHFVIEAVENISLDKFKTNAIGTGSKQYHPHQMLSLLIYSYANGVFGSRRIERATYRDIAVRYLCANTHPDHDTICKFRRDNFAAVSEAFLYVLKLARELKLLQVGTISVDGTKIKANASKNKSIRYDRAKELEQQLTTDIKELMEKAERADAEQENDSQKLPEEVCRRQKLREKMAKARQILEGQAQDRAKQQQVDYEEKLSERQQRKDQRGKHPQPPSAKPLDTEQVNLTDVDSRLMRRNRHSEYQQAYNAQAAVDADGSQLILGVVVSQSAGDHGLLAVDVLSVPRQIGTPKRVLADNGYASENEVEAVEKDNIEVLVSVHSEAKQAQRRYDFRPSQIVKVKEKKEGPYVKEWVKRMADKMNTAEAQKQYRFRKQTVEPVFGIIKQAMGFRQFLLRGAAKVAGEWSLVATAYNFRRLYVLKTA